MIGSTTLIALFLFLLILEFVAPRLCFHTRFSTRVRILAALIASIWAFRTLTWSQMFSVFAGTDFVEPWSSFVLYLSFGYLATSLDCAGILQAVAFWLTQNRTYEPFNTHFISFLTTMTSSALLGPYIMIASGTPVLIQYVQALGLREDPWLVSSFAAANIAGTIFPWGAFANLILLEGLGMPIPFTAFSVYTIPPFLACATSSFHLLFPQPATENRPIQRDVALSKHDQSFENVAYEGRRLRAKITNTFRKGRAIISATVLGAFLVGILAGSLFNYARWKVALLFVIPAMCFDALADHYQFKTEWPGLYRHLRSNHHQPSQFEMEDSSDSDEDDDEFDPIDPLPPQLRGLVGIEETQEAEGMGPVRISDSATRNPTNDSPSLLLEEGIVALRSEQAPRLTEQQNINTFIASRGDFNHHFPTLALAINQIPFTIIPLTIYQLLLIKALDQAGWIKVFSRWLLSATDGGQMSPMIWLVGPLYVVLYNLAGTNVGAVLLLGRILQETRVSDKVLRAATISLVVAGNLAPVIPKFSVSYTRNNIADEQSAKRNRHALIVMLVVGLLMVNAEMIFLFD